MAGCMTCELPQVTPENDRVEGGVIYGAPPIFHVCHCGRPWMFYNGRWFVRIGQGGPCAEGACSYVGHRLVCWHCPEGEIRDAQFRCEAHHAEHRRVVHAAPPADALCTCTHRNGEHVGPDGLGACDVFVRPGELCPCEAFVCLNLG